MQYINEVYLGWILERYHLDQEQKTKSSTPEREQEIRILVDLIRIVHTQKMIKPIGEIVDLTQLFYSD